MRSLPISMVAAVVAVVVAVSGCGQTAPQPTPVQAPTAPPKAAEPTKAPTAPIVPTTAPTAAPAKQTDFPVKGKTITMLVPYSAGGATDLVARLLGTELESGLGTPVQVVNRVGASGQIAATELVQSNPDGYTIMITALPTTLSTYLDPQRKAIYSRKDFAMLARVTAASVNVAARADGPYKTLKDLIDAAKAKPDTIALAAGTQLSGYHLSALQMEKVTGADFALVNFDGGVQGVTALLGDHVEASVNQPGELLNHVQAGTIRLLGVMMDDQASKFFPDVKTLESQGYKVYALSQAVVVAPASTPKEVVDILSAQI